MLKSSVFILFIFFTIQSCQLQSKSYMAEKPVDVILQLPSKEKIRTKIVFTDEDQSRGLSGIASSQFAPDQAMLFFYFHDNYRSFWMPDTYFDLDIFFVDKDLVIIDVQRNVPHHPGRNEPPSIARTRSVKCRHVLELRADSVFAKKLKIGDKLNWKSSPYPEQIKPKTHL